MNFDKNKELYYGEVILIIKNSNLSFKEFQSPSTTPCFIVITELFLPALLRVAEPDWGSSK